MSTPGDTSDHIGNPSWQATAPDRPMLRLVVGMSRAGTTWMIKTLSQHPDVAGWGESLYWGRAWIEPGSDGRWTDEQARDMAAAVRRIFAEMPEIARREGQASRDDMKLGHWTDDQLSAAIEGIENTAARLTHAADHAADYAPDHAPDHAADHRGVLPGELFVAINDAVANAAGKTVGIESTPHHLNHLARIRSELERAGVDLRVLVMTRPPEAFMLSYKHQGDRKADFVRREFRRLYHPASCALVWKRSAESIERARALDPDGSWTLVRSFEDIRGDRMDEVLSFFGLDPCAIDTARAASNTSFARGERPALKPEDLFWLRAIAGSALRNGGHEVSRPKLAPLRLIGSVLRLPVTAWWTFWILRGRTGVGIGRYLAGFLKR